MIVSPCISICKNDPVTGYCYGCARTSKEKIIWKDPITTDEWKKETGSPASVVNRPGGGDGPFPGALEVLDAPADGSVIGSFVIGVPIVGPRIDIGIESDSFEPVGIFLTYPFVLAASGSASYSNLSELAAHAKTMMWFWVILVLALCRQKLHLLQQKN